MIAKLVKYGVAIALVLILVVLVSVFCSVGVNAMAHGGSLRPELARVAFTGGILKIFGMSDPVVFTQTGRSGFYTPKGEATVMQVMDLRGTDAGWSLTAALKDFYHNGAPGALPGAELALSWMEPAKGIATGYGVRPFINTGAALSADGSLVPMAYAAQGSGGGIWTFRVQPGDALLTVPDGGALQGNYYASLQWVLQLAP